MPAGNCEKGCAEGLLPEANLSEGARASVLWITGGSNSLPAFTDSRCSDLSLSAEQEGHFGVGHSAEVTGQFWFP